MKIVKNIKPTLLDKIEEYIRTYKILTTSKSFKWSLLKYFFLETILNRYETVKLKSDKRLLVLLLVKKYNAENFLQIREIIALDNLKKGVDVNILQEFKTKLNSYRTLGFKAIEVTFQDYLIDNALFFTNELGFTVDREKELNNAINFQTNIIPLIKKLT